MIRCPYCTYVYRSCTPLGFISDKCFWTLILFFSKSPMGYFYAHMSTWVSAVWLMWEWHVHCTPTYMQWEVKQGTVHASLSVHNTKHLVPFQQTLHWEVFFSHSDHSHEQLPAMELCTAANNSMNNENMNMKMKMKNTSWDMMISLDNITITQC